MAQAVIPLMAVGGVLSATNTWQQGQMASRAATSQARLLNYNASLAEEAASRAQGSSQLKAAETKRQNQRLISKQINLAAASGASTKEKNIADLIARTAQEGEYAALVDLYEGDLRADALRNEALSYRIKASNTLAEGKAARKAGNIQAISSLIGSGASTGSFYSKYNRKAPTDYEYSGGFLNQ